MARGANIAVVVLLVVVGACLSAQAEPYEPGVPTTSRAYEPGFKTTSRALCLDHATCAVLHVSTIDPVVYCSGSGDRYECHVTGTFTVDLVGRGFCVWARSDAAPTLDPLSRCVNAPAAERLDNHTMEGARYEDVPARGRVLAVASTLCLRPLGTPHDGTPLERCITFPHHVWLPGRPKYEMDDEVRFLAGWADSWYRDVPMPDAPRGNPRPALLP